jgi:mono/diheme cytochrome c family protein
MKRSLLMITIVLFARAGYTQHKIEAQQNDTVKNGVRVASVSSPLRIYDFEQITRGRKLYLQYCAECHGKNAEGSPNWRQKNPDGKYPPPPLNGTGHAWHHPMNVLRMTIRDGTQKLGGSMPAWGGKLSQQEIDDIIAWIQGEWPDDIWQAWYKRNQRSTSR